MSELAALQARLDHALAAIATLHRDLDAMRLSCGIIQERFDSVRLELADTKRELAIAQVTLLSYAKRPATERALDKLRTEGLL